MMLPRCGAAQHKSKKPMAYSLRNIPNCVRIFFFASSFCIRYFLKVIFSSGVLRACVCVCSVLWAYVITSVCDICSFLFFYSIYDFFQMRINTGAFYKQIPTCGISVDIVSIGRSASLRLPYIKCNHFRTANFTTKSNVKTNKSY